MSATPSFADAEEQHAELLPARTVLSLFSAASGDTIVGDTCNLTHTSGPTGLAALLGLGAQASNTLLCQPSLFVYEAPAGQAAATS